MKSTAKYTLFVGFLFSSMATFVILNFGTDFKVMTIALYLYAFSSLIGGVIGYRRAWLKHSGRHSDPGLPHIFGLDKFWNLFSTKSIRVSLENDSFEAEEAELSENLISVEREQDNRIYGMSYPRKRLVALKRS
ncbi:MAG: hypothetical protein SVV03_03240 [Candidatus Nanohaloarchaea archaeon]|nr:hypothetical protein [Candidatus Nanohaloarchaea archaeon]